MDRLENHPEKPRSRRHRFGPYCRCSVAAAALAWTCPAIAADAPATLQDDATTASLHADSTILRNVDVTSKNDVGELELGPLQLWLGALVQYDAYHINGIFTNGSDGQGNGGQQARRLQGVLRSRLYDWGELKAEYDLKQRSVEDLYVRWVSRLTPLPYTITLGNQKEPMGLNYLTGSAFTTAQEPAAPEAAFGEWRSLGLSMHRAFALNENERELGFRLRRHSALTTSVGVFTEDLDGTNDTALAVTGRLTVGQNREEGSYHLGMAASVREASGQYDQIAFRPEIKEADRVLLAQPEADRLVIGALEGAMRNGSFSLQGEAYIGDYLGKTDGLGAGAYLLASWIATGEQREYLADWGVFAPLQPARGKYIVELFARTSAVNGEDDDHENNVYGAVTLGGNIYYRRLKGSLNLIYGRAENRVNTERDGIGLDARVQFLF